LKRQRDAPDTEIIVVGNYPDILSKQLDAEFASVRLLELPAETTVPELRAYGVARSRGEIVALLEDNCVVDEHWCAELKKAHDLSYSIVGGSVEQPSRRRSVDWAVYFYEYGQYMLPLKCGETEALAGNNVSYKKSLLARFEGQYREGLYEAFLHRELRRQGLMLYLAPTAVVYHTKQYEAGPVLIQCFHHGRHFAGRRILDASRITRVALLGGSMLLPLILPLRIAMRVFKKGRHLREMWRSLPYLMLFMASWAYGEFCGYLLGEGNSAKRWV
jgi:hypothetical protein